MANMSYCRFENTLADLRECHQHWEDLPEGNNHEKKAQADLLALCKQIVSDYGDDDDEEEGCYDCMTWPCSCDQQ